jgi:hypothetical protein
MTASKCEKYVKNTISKHRIIKPWITHALVIAIRKKENIFKLTKKYPQDEDIKRYFRKYPNKLTYLIKKSKKRKIIII